MKMCFKTCYALAKQKSIVFSWLISLAFVLAGYTFLYFQLYPTMVYQGFVPLHYNVLMGIDMFGPWWQLFTTPVIATVVFLANTIGAIRFWPKDRVIAYAFIFTSTFVSIIAFIALMFIIRLNLTYYG